MTTIIIQKETLIGPITSIKVKFELKIELEI